MPKAFVRLVVILAILTTTALTQEISGLVHLQDLYDRPLTNGAWAGTKGESRRLEGFQLNITPSGSGLMLNYLCHLQNIGDVQKQEGEFCGTRGQSRRLEGLAIALTGPNANQYNIFYQCHIEGYGDSGVFSNGDFCGTRGESKRLEAMRVWIERKPPNIPQTTQYVVRFSRMAVVNTRSRHEDTDYVSLAVEVDGRMYGPVTKHLGDLNNGTYSPDLSLEVTASPASTIKVAFVAVNSGHPSDGDTITKLGQSTVALAAKAVGASTPITAVATTVVNILGKLFFANCDGVVAGDAFVMGSTDLYSNTSNGTYTHSKEYFGTDSPSGCGSNSKYEATISVSRK